MGAQRAGMEHQRDAKGWLTGHHVQGKLGQRLIEAGGVSTCTKKESPA